MGPCCGILAPLCLAALLAGGCAPSASPAPRPGPSEQAPGVGVRVALDVAPAPLSPTTTQPLGDVIQGRVVLVDFWASWCAPCRDAVPKLIGLHRAYGPQGLVVVGVDVGENPETVRRFVQEAGIEYPVYLDREFAFADAMGAREVPTVLLVDADGRVRSRHAGLDTAVVARVRELLAHPASP